MFDDMRMRENSGRLIKVYRELRNSKEKDRRFSCNEFVLATKDYPFFEIASGSPVCSRATLNRLERGYAIKDDDLYYFFIEKLGFKAKEFPGLLDQAEKIGEYLYRAVEKYDVDDISRLDSLVELMFKEAKEYFYYQEIYNAFKTISSYYLNAEYPNDLVASYSIETSFLLGNNLKEILFNILFDYYYYCKLEIPKAEVIINELLDCRKESKLSNLFISGWLLFKERYLDALACVDEGIEYFHSIHSSFHLGTLYFTKALALHTGNKINVKCYFDQSIDDLRQCKGRLAEKKLINNYFNIGFHYYFDKDYQTAYTYFEKFLEYKPNFTIHFLYILQCMEELKIKSLDNTLKNITIRDSDKDGVCNIFYKYFKMKLENRQEKELEDYIMGDIFRFLKNNRRYDNLILYFGSELSKLVKVTKKYKDIEKFVECTSHNV